MDFQYEPNRIFLQDGERLLAEITFPVADGVADINHTFVDASLGGQGIAAKLVQCAADTVRSKGWKAVTSCSYARAWFEKHPEQSDLLAE